MSEQRADPRLFFTELLGLKVFDLKGRTLGVVKDAAIVPLLDPVRVDRYPDRQRRGLAHGPPRSGPLHIARRHSSAGRNPDSVSFRRIYAARGPRPSGSADHRCAGPQGGARNRRHLRDPSRKTAAKSCGCWTWISGCGRFSGAWCRECCLRAGSGGCRAASRPTPFAGSSATFWSPIRSGACGSTFRTGCWKTCIRPTWPTSSRT